MRSYLIKKGFDFVEKPPAEAFYQKEIPQLIGYFVIPVVELRDGVLLQDSTETMVHLEQDARYPGLVPSTPLQRAAAWILNFFGSDGFAKPGMHYRWGFEQNRSSLAANFLQWTPDVLSLTERKQQAAVLMERYASYCSMLGISAETIPAIEASWLHSIDLLDKHFGTHPYLLGGRPSIGDCGLMTWFYAHLSRDPCPGNIMKRRAPHVFRWTERMNRSGLAAESLPDVAPNYHPDDSLPETLLPFLQYLIAECGTEVKETVVAYNRWINSNAELAPGDVLKPQGSAAAPHPGFAWIEYGLRGTTIRRMAFIDTVYQYQEVGKVVDQLSEADRRRLLHAIGNSGDDWIVTLRPDRAIRYELYNYVLA